ncbi:MAG: MBL fold metallo-hydrolase [Defluviitaleaceae bacterium]|nr:MBL fold metallo-hydrolase [Defluviitaleaceae bacterium]
MSVKFCTIASGSSGNCTYVAAGNNAVLVDAGLAGRVIEEGLQVQGIDPKSLTAIFVTHDHGDHIKGAGVLSRRFNLPLYMTAGTWAYAEKYKILGKISPANKMVVRNGVDVKLDCMTITPFTLPHDASEPVGYAIYAQGCKVAIATDLGHVSPHVATHIAGADIVLIEANYDKDMLARGPYPAHLKQRISGTMGHLSNVCCGAFLADIICGKTKYVFLGHLSQENNRPIIAHETIKNILLARKIDVGGAIGLYVADRHRPSAMITLNDGD